MTTHVKKSNICPAEEKKIREIQDENSQTCRLKKKSTKSEIVRVSRVEARRKTPPKVDTIFSAFDENIRDMNPDLLYPDPDKDEFARKVGR